MAVVDLLGADAGGIVDDRVLIALDGFPVFAVEFQEFDVDLNLMTWHLFLVSVSMDLANTGTTGQSAEAVAPESAIHACVGDGDA